MNMLSGWQAVFRGIGTVYIDAGNLANAPGNPPVQQGNYEWIQDYLYRDESYGLSQIPEIPAPFRDWSGYPLNLDDGSGNFGGGDNAGLDYQVATAPVLYYDTETSLYYDIG
jgi:hypothetical protein